MSVDIKAYAELQALLTSVGDPSAHTLTSLAAKFGDIARSLDLILGARWDAAGDLGTDIASELISLAALDTELDALVAAGIAMAGIVADATPAITDFDTNLAEATNNHYNGQLLMFTTGVCLGQAHQVDSYTGGTKNMAFATSDQWTDAPGNGDAFVLIPSPGAYLKKLFAAMALEATSQLIKTQTDKLAGAAPVTGTATANWNTATGTSGEAGEDLVTLGVAATRYKVHSLLLDISALTDGAIIHVKLFQKINGNERKVYDQAFTVPTTAAGETPPPDTLGLWIVNGTLVIHDTLRVEVYSNTSENVAIAYTAILEAM